MTNIEAERGSHPKDLRSQKFDYPVMPAKAEAEQRHSQHTVRNDLLVVPVGSGCSLSPSLGGTSAVCHWCNSSTPVRSDTFYKGTVNESPTYFMFCVHCKHCSDEIVCLPANVSSEP